MDGRELFDAIVDSAVLLDKAGRIINWNAGASALFGYSRREVLGRSINLIYDRNYPFPKLIQETHNNQKRWQGNTNFISKKGHKGICITYLCPLPLNEQNKVTALLIHQNVTQYNKTANDLRAEREQLETQLRIMNTGFWNASTLLVDLIHQVEQSERKLRESELRFHLLAQNATDVISRYTPDGSCLYVSPSCKSALGYEHDQLIGRSIFKMVHHDDHVKVRKAFTRRRDNANNKPLVYRIKRREGEFRWFESNIRLIMDEQTRLISEVQLASRDITDRVLDKKARLRGQQLAHVFRLSTMEEMASGMAHEISQPLAAIVNYTRGCVLHLEKNERDDDVLKKIMGKAVSQAERAGEIIQRLKNFFCKGQLVKTPNKMNNVVRETIGLMKNELTQSKTKVDYNFDKTMPLIFIDKIQIQQVLLNMIQNAIEAMHERYHKEKRIHIHVKNIAKNIEITMRDTGPGFPKENINDIFMPFFTTKAHGRGMGLAICRSIVEAHGGQFTLNPTTANNNSWIRFSLPISI